MLEWIEVDKVMMFVQSRVNFSFPGNIQVGFCLQVVVQAAGIYVVCASWKPKPRSRSRKKVQKYVVG